MRTSFTLLLIALLCCSALSTSITITVKETIQVGSLTYTLGKDGNDCVVARTYGGYSVWRHYTRGAANPGDCVPLNIFALDYKIVVVFSVTENQNLFRDENIVQGVFSSSLVFPVVGNAIVIGYIDVSSDEYSFGRFMQGATDVAFEKGVQSSAPIKYVSAVACDDKKSIELTVNVKSQYELRNFPSGNPVNINGNRVKQVWNSEDGSLTAYKAGEAPFCTASLTAAEESSGMATWALSLLGALPAVAIIILIIYFAKNGIPFTVSVWKNGTVAVGVTHELNNGVNIGANIEVNPEGNLGVNLEVNGPSQ